MVNSHLQPSQIRVFSDLKGNSNNLLQSNIWFGFNSVCHFIVDDDNLSLITNLSYKFLHPFFRF